MYRGKHERSGLSLPLMQSMESEDIKNYRIKAPKATDQVECHYEGTLIDGTGMIHYIQPVAHVLTLTIYWQWLAMTDIVDEQRNQLLWELVWTVVVRAVGYDGRHTVCIVESADEVV